MPAAEEAADAHAEDSAPKAKLPAKAQAAKAKPKARES